MLDIQVLEIIGPEPVTLAEAKAYCKIDGDYTGEDAILTDIISSARSSIEMWANISIVEKRIQVYSDTDKTLWLPRSPVIEIESAVDADGNNLPFDPKVKNKITFKYSGDYYITYKAGFQPLPPDIKLAVLKQIATDYDNRENFIVNGNNQVQSASNLSNSTKNLVRPYNRNLCL